MLIFFLSHMMQSENKIPYILYNQNLRPLSCTSLWEELGVNILECLLIYETTGTFLRNKQK